MRGRRGASGSSRERTSGPKRNCRNPVGFRDNSLSQASRWESGPKARGSPPECALASPTPCSTRSRPSPTPSAPASRPTSRTSTGRSSRSSTCPRRSRARCSPATRATRARCGGCSSTSSPTRCPRAQRLATAPRARRAAELYERIFLGYGDDSVAQLGGAHVACEWVSNVLTKVLQRPRLAAYLEQSTRYIAYDAPMPGGGYRYYRDPELGPDYEQAMDALFDTYADALPRVAAWVDGRVPARDELDAARRRAIKAKALDLLRGLLPAASLSHMGIYATGQTYEQLILHLLAHPLPEARALRAADPRGRQGGHAELRHARRAPRPRRRVGRLPRGAASAPADRWVRAPGPRPRRPSRTTRPSVRLLHVDGDEDALLAALLFEAAGVRRGGDARPPWPRSAAPSARELLARPRRRARATAATARAAASRRCATASRSSPTTAPSATSSATACSPSSGSRSRPTSAPACPRRSRRPAAATLYRRALDVLADRVRAARRRGPRARGALRALPRLPHPLRARPQRARGDAADRAALRARGPPELPRRRARDAPPDRRRSTPPSRRR